MFFIIKKDIQCRNLLFRSHIISHIEYIKVGRDKVTASSFNYQYGQKRIIEQTEAILKKLRNFLHKKTKYPHDNPLRMLNFFNFTTLIYSFGLVDSCILFLFPNRQNSLQYSTVFAQNLDNRHYYEQEILYLNKSNKRDTSRNVNLSDCYDTEL